MNRSNPFQNIQKTFASVPKEKGEQFTKTTKRKSKSKSSIRSSTPVKKSSQDFKIDDSDEENSSCQSEIAAAKRRKPTKTTLKLSNMITNSSAHASFLNTSCLNISDSDESVNFDSEDDSTSHSKLLHSCDKKSVRKKSLPFLSEKSQNESISTNNCDSSKDSRKMKERIRNFQDTFNGNNSRLSDPKISDAESCDENDTDGHQKIPSEKRKQSTDIVYSSTQQSTDTFTIDTQSSQRSIKFPSQAVYDPNKTRSEKPIKPVEGGWVEMLNKAINRSKSELAFWLNERTSNLNEPGETMRIEKRENSYGRVLLHCKCLDDTIKILFVDPAHKKLSALKVGKIIEVGFDSPGYEIEKNVYSYPDVTKILLKL